MNNAHNAPRHHRPHLLSDRINEMRQFGATDSVLKLLIEDVAQRYSLDISAMPNGNITELTTLLDNKILEQREDRLMSMFQPADANVLIAGEMPPHVIEELLHTGARITQTHPIGAHGDYPPHFRHFERNFPNFSKAGAPDELMNSSVTIIAAHAYRAGTELLVTRHTSFAARIWPQASLLIFLADHRAPHHIETLGNRNLNLEIPE